MGTYSAGQQQTSAVGCCVVSQTHRDSVFGQFVRVSGTHDHVTLDLGIGDLQHNRKKMKVDSAVIAVMENNWSMTVLFFLKLLKTT